MDWKDACETAYQNGRESAANKLPCEKCSGEYNQEFMTFHVRYHTNADTEVHQIPTRFCPQCGRQLIAPEKEAQNE